MLFSKSAPQIYPKIGLIFDAPAKKIFFVDQCNRSKCVAVYVRIQILLANIHFFATVKKYLAYTNHPPYMLMVFNYTSRAQRYC